MSVLYQPPVDISTAARSTLSSWWDDFVRKFEYGLVGESPNAMFPTITSPLPAPAVPSGALQYPYQPMQEQINAAQLESIQNWGKGAITAKGPEEESNGGVGIFATIVIGVVAYFVLIKVLDRR